MSFMMPNVMMMVVRETVVMREDAVGDGMSIKEKRKKDKRR